MIIATHIIIAILSVVCSTTLFFIPKKSLFYATYSLVGATLASGTYLVIQTHSSIAHACITGTVFLGVVLLGVVPAHAKQLSKG